jgi:hypothetical protein
MDLVRTADGGHSVYDLLARPPLFGVGADMNGIGTLREHGPHLLGIARAQRFEQLVKHRPDFILAQFQPCASPLASAGYRAVSSLPRAQATADPGQIPPGGTCPPPAAFWPSAQCRIVRAWSGEILPHGRTAPRLLASCDTCGFDRLMMPVTGHGPVSAGMRGMRRSAG